MDTRRLWRVACALLASAACLVQAQEGKPGVRWLVQNSPLAGFSYHAAAQVWQELRIGDALELAREPENLHDANAVVVIWRGRKLGYVPRRDNAALAWGLDRGEPLRARISDLSHHPNPARRVRFEVFVE